MDLYLIWYYFSAPAGVSGGYFTEIFLGIAIVYVIVKLVFWLVYSRR